MQSDTLSQEFGRTRVPVDGHRTNVLRGLECNGVNVAELFPVVRSMPLSKQSKVLLLTS
jgi:hypothetical protein